MHPAWELFAWLLVTLNFALATQSSWVMVLALAKVPGLVRLPSLVMVLASVGKLALVMVPALVAKPLQLTVGSVAEAASGEERVLQRVYPTASLPSARKLRVEVPARRLQGEIAARARRARGRRGGPVALLLLEAEVAPPLRLLKPPAAGMLPASLLLQAAQHPSSRSPLVAWPYLLKAPAQAMPTGWFLLLGLVSHQWCCG